jgi:hypothetical protein
VGRRVLIWILFSVGISLLPVVFNLLTFPTFNISLSVANVLGSGELLMVAVGLSGAALGELFGTSRQSETARILITFFSFINAACAAFYYALTVGRYTVRGQDPNAVVIVSLGIFAVAVACGGSAVALPRR